MKRPLRIQKLTSYYPGYLRQFYGRRPDLASQPYSDQHRALMDDCVGLSNFWTAELNKLGFETDEVVPNAEPLQKRWALECGLSYEKPNWLLEIATAQVKTFRPEVLIIADYVTFTASYLRQLRSECPSIRLILGWCSAPYRDASVFTAYDVVLSCVPELVEHFRELGHCSIQVNHAFEPRILEKIDLAAPPSVNFSFLGSIVKGNKHHNERERLLLDLVERTDLEIWSDLNRLTLRERSGIHMRQLAYDMVGAGEKLGGPGGLLKRLPFVDRVAGWERRPVAPEPIDQRIAARTHPPLFGLEMYQKLRESRVALNTHIDISPISASNMRLFEATGVGTCLLTDWKRNLSDLFEPDVEVACYKNSDECFEKLSYLLQHDDERQAIATAAQQRTLRDHNYSERAARIAQIIYDHYR